MLVKPRQILESIFIITVVFCPPLLAQETKPELAAELKEKVDSLIHKLGDDKYTVREAAQAEIAALLQDTKTFDAVIPYLKQVMDTTQDVEVKVRLERVTKHWSPTLEKDIIAAVSSGDASTVKNLLEKGADINTKDDWHWTLLRVAAAKGHLDVVKLLVANGADVNDRDSCSRNLLHPVGQWGRSEVAEFLIAQGVGVNAKDCDGETPLHTIWISTPENAKMNNEDVEGMKNVARLLLANGADVNAKDSRGWTPLHGVARSDRNKELVELYLSKGANVNARDNRGYTPLDWAVDGGDSADVQQILRDHGGILKFPFRIEIMDAAAKGDLEQLKKFLAVGVSLRVSNSSGDTPLHIAARKGSRQITEFLLANGAEVDARDCWEQTPLYQTSSGEIAKILIARGANVNGMNGVFR